MIYLLDYFDEAGRQHTVRVEADDVRMVTINACRLLKCDVARVKSIAPIAPSPSTPSSSEAVNG